MARAREMGFEVSKPFGDSARYDVTVEYKGRFLRIQVKSTSAERCGGYSCLINRDGKHGYTDEQIDFLAIYVVPKDVWYIVPVEVGMKLKRQIFFMPGHKEQKYEAYQEAWHLLREELGAGKAGDESGFGDEEAIVSEAQPLAAEVDPDAEPGDIGEMRGAVDPPPAVGWDPDLVRRRMEATFARLKGR